MFRSLHKKLLILFSLSWGIGSLQSAVVPMSHLMVAIPAWLIAAATKSLTIDLPLGLLSVAASEKIRDTVWGKQPEQQPRGESESNLDYFSRMAPTWAKFSASMTVGQTLVNSLASLSLSYIKLCADVASFYSTMYAEAQVPICTSLNFVKSALPTLSTGIGVVGSLVAGKMAYEAYNERFPKNKSFSGGSYSLINFLRDSGSVACPLLCSGMAYATYNALFPVLYSLANFSSAGIGIAGSWIAMVLMGAAYSKFKLAYDDSSKSQDNNKGFISTVTSKARALFSGFKKGFAPALASKMILLSSSCWANTLVDQSVRSGSWPLKLYFVTSHLATSM